MNLTFAHSIKKLRTDKKVNVKELVQKLNTEERTYYNWEEGRNQIPLDKLQELATYYQMTIDEVVNYANQDQTFNNITTNQKGNGFVFEQGDKETIAKQLTIIENLTTLLTNAQKELEQFRKN
jgi:transcriptional regulator with XRE-family HTH domain